MKRSKLPVQAAPVERTTTGTPISSQSGVDPSGLIGDAWDYVKNFFSR